MKRVLLAIALYSTATGVFAQGGSITFSPLSTAVPSLTPMAMAVLGSLFLYFGLRRFKGKASRVGLLLLAGLGLSVSLSEPLGLLVGKVQASVMGTPVTQAQGQTLNLNSGLNRFNNNSGVSLRITAITAGSCDSGRFGSGLGGETECAVSLVLPDRGSCSINCSTGQ